MIPKKIHYCWFGFGDMPEVALNCIESWKKHLSDYEFVLWNEDTFDINLNDYVREAYQKKMYAFVTDYVRLLALYSYGGVYMDTDIEVLRSLDNFLSHRAFTGCQEKSICVTGIIASEKSHPWIKNMLNYYNNRHFIITDGSLDTTPNTTMITELTTNLYDWKPCDKYQVLKDDLHIYETMIFCAKDWRSGKINVNDKTYAIHHFNGSWLSEKDRKRSRQRKVLAKIIGKEWLERLIDLKNLIIKK